jgi:DNA-binding GntR family transcriptional regulator
VKVARLLYIGNPYPDRQKATEEEHLGIVRALEAKDRDRLIRILRHHIQWRGDSHARNDQPPPSRATRRP